MLLSENWSQPHNECKIPTRTATKSTTIMATSHISLTAMFLHCIAHFLLGLARSLGLWKRWQQNLQEGINIRSFLHLRKKWWCAGSLERLVQFWAPEKIGGSLAVTRGLHTVLFRKFHLLFQHTKGTASTTFLKQQLPSFSTTDMSRTSWTTAWVRETGSKMVSSVPCCALMSLQLYLQLPSFTSGWQNHTGSSWGDQLTTWISTPMSFWWKRKLEKYPLHRKASHHRVYGFLFIDISFQLLLIFMLLVSVICLLLSLSSFFSWSEYSF